MNFSRVTDLLHEVGMLRHTPRSGYQFLGTGHETVAEHSHRTAVIGYVLARLAGADPARTALICLFHDLGEARTGDQNYVNKRYVSTREREAICDATAGTPFGAEFLDFFDAHAHASAPDAPLESRLARDADQLDFLLNLKCEHELGNPRAAQWMEVLVQRLLTDIARELAAEIVRRPSSSFLCQDLQGGAAPLTPAGGLEGPPSPAVAAKKVP